MTNLSGASDSYSIGLFCQVLGRYHVGTMIVTAEGRICSLNPALAHTLDCPQNTLVDTLFIQYIHPDDRQNMEQRFQHLVSQDKDFQLTARFIRSDNGIAWGKFNGLHLPPNPVFPAAAAVVTVEDVTPHYHLRDILATISLSSEILWKYDEQLPSEKRREHLRTIVESAAKLTAVL